MNAENKKASHALTWKANLTLFSHTPLLCSYSWFGGSEKSYLSLRWGSLVRLVFRPAWLRNHIFIAHR